MTFVNKQLLLNDMKLMISFTPEAIKKPQTMKFFHCLLLYFLKNASNCDLKYTSESKASQFTNCRMLSFFAAHYYKDITFQSLHGRSLSPIQ
jgi:hypothetical protein